MRFAPLLVLLAACGRPPHVGGIVTVAVCNGPSTSPVAGAQVLVRCPERPAPVVSAVTDEHGRFDADPEHVVPLQCSFEISRDGYLTRTVSVADACAVTTAKGATTCQLAGLTVELQVGQN